MKRALLSEEGPEESAWMRPRGPQSPAVAPELIQEEPLPAAEPRSDQGPPWSLSADSSLHHMALCIYLTSFVLSHDHISSFQKLQPLVSHSDA